MIDVFTDLLKEVPTERWLNVMTEWKSERVDFLVLYANEGRRRVLPVGEGHELKTLARAFAKKDGGWRCLAYCCSEKTLSRMMEARIRAKVEGENRQNVGGENVVLSLERLKQLEGLEEHLKETESFLVARMNEIAEREAVLEQLEEEANARRFQTGKFGG